LVELPGKAASQGCEARLLGKAAGQGCRARLPGKAAGQSYMHAMAQYAEQLKACSREIGRKCSILPKKKNNKAILRPALYVRTNLGKNTTHQVLDLASRVFLPARACKAPRMYILLCCCCCCWGMFARPLLN
jgi:hypothetical protein